MNDTVLTYDENFDLQLKNVDLSVISNKIHQQESSYIINALSAFENGLIKLTAAQLVNVKHALNYYQNVGFSAFVKNGNKARMLNEVSSNIVGSPLRVKNAAKTYITDLMLKIDVIYRDYEARNGKKAASSLKAYMITKSVRNSAKTALKQEVDTLYKVTAHQYKLIRQNQIRYAAAIANNVQPSNAVKNGVLRDVNGNVANIVAAVSSFELTLNEQAFLNESDANLYHPHFHDIIITDSELNVDAASDFIYSDFEKRVKKHNFYCDKQAFDLVECYTKENTPTDSYLRSALSEASKYVVKPTMFSLFDDVLNSDYQREVFAEIYNTIYSRQAHRTYFEFKFASKFVRDFEHVKSAFVAARSFDKDTAAKTVMTELATFAIKTKATKNGYISFNSQLLSTRDLTTDELILHNSHYFNKTLINRGLLSDAAAYIVSDLVHDATDEEKALYMRYSAVLKSYETDVNHSISEVLDSFSTRVWVVKAELGELEKKQKEILQDMADIESYISRNLHVDYNKKQFEEYSVKLKAVEAAIFDFKAELVSYNKLLFAARDFFFDTSAACSLNAVDSIYLPVFDDVECFEYESFKYTLKIMHEPVQYSDFYVGAKGQGLVGFDSYMLSDAYRMNCATYQNAANSVGLPVGHRTRSKWGYSVNANNEFRIVPHALGTDRFSVIHVLKNILA